MASLERLLKLIELANENDEDAEEEARTAAVAACRIIKREGVELVFPSHSGLPDAEWAVQTAAVTLICSACDYEIEEGSKHFVRRSDNKQFHAGCLP